MAKEINTTANKAKIGLEAKTASHVLLRPRITEKATFRAHEGNVYVFEIPTSASKKDVARAVREIYKIDPVKVATTMIPRKRVIVRGKAGVKSAGKKAYVYLKQGDKIEFV